MSNLQNLAIGTEIFAIGTDWTAKVISSEISERGNRVVEFEWTCSVHHTEIREGVRGTWVHGPKTRCPRFVVAAPVAD